MYNNSELPNFWLALVAGAGLLAVPVYFVKCMFIITIEPECYYETRTEPLRLRLLNTEPKVPEWSQAVIDEFWEAYQEVLKSRKWSNSTKTESELEVIDTTLLFEQKERIKKKHLRD
jgi:hypothetical protein